MLSPTTLTLLGLATTILSTPVERALFPSATISHPQATVIGSSSLLVESFNGIPYALPPVGPLRLKPPKPITSPLGTIKAIGIPKACPQMFISSDSTSITSLLGVALDLPLFQTITNAGEDCLTINVQRPAGTTSSSNLPVLFWIFGGGFELGSTQIYDGSNIIRESITDDHPVIFVAVNYRVAGFGFMPGAEILADGSANLGLLDQRLGLEWVADNIAAFGGDPERVTIWGESAGSISVADQIALYDGDNTYKGRSLFRGAIMDSGSLVPADAVDCPKGQEVYDTVVSRAGCSAANDTLACLRELPYSDFLNAANSVPGLLSYSSVALSYLPRPGGKALAQSPDVLFSQGKYAAVPMIIGDQEDEGTFFSLVQSNLSTTAEVESYLRTYFFHDATAAQIKTLVAAYPDDPREGSPFNTGQANSLYPQYKRLAAILGDLTFTLTRRIFLNITSTIHPEVPSWSYLSSYTAGTPLIGTFHGSDLLAVFLADQALPSYPRESFRSYYFSFVYTLDPNQPAKGKKRYLNWPRWGSENGGVLLHTLDEGAELLGDGFRKAQYDALTKEVGVGSLYI